MNELIYVANKIVYFILLFLLVTIGLLLILKIIVSRKKNTKLKNRLIGLLSANTFLINLSYALVYVFFVFSLWFIIFNKDFTNLSTNWSFYYLISPILLLDIINGAIFKIFSDILEVLILYFANFLKNGFLEYANLINNSWYIKLLCYSASLFLGLYAILLVVKNIKFIVLKKRKEVNYAKTNKTYKEEI